ncbi:MAG: pyridoxamine kinase [Oscillospiraceae bacterium]|nr:pyridoxamine kinase [Oscillospiraceae bacterium]
MSYRRILTIQDISCLGQCSLTVALPILSACGVETCVLPSAVLSSHTGGFKYPHFRDLTEDMPAIAEHWKREGITFDGILTGYLGSVRQIDYAKQIFDGLTAEGGRIVVDPAMADHGKLYKGFDNNHVIAMKHLCTNADVVIPNLTEACMLTDLPYGKTEPETAVKKLHEMGIPNVILTGVSKNPDTTGILVSEKGNMRYHSHRKISQSYHGTGDIFAAAFMGAWMQDKELFQAGKIAAEFTSSCIAHTHRNPAHWYGVKFEEALPELIEALK